MIVPLSAICRRERSKSLDPFSAAEVLKVNVSKGAAAGYEIKFDPLPPAGRLYFFTKTAQVFRLEKLSPMVLIQDLETGEKSELKLVEFVKQVQSGVWLLKPGSGE